MRTLGPPQAAFGVPHPTQSPQTLNSAPELRSSRNPQEAGTVGASEARRFRGRAVWTPPLPLCGPAPRWPLSWHRRSALWALRNDRCFQSPGTRPLRCSFGPDPCALSLRSGSPLHFLVFSWQKGVSLVVSKMPPRRPWVGSNHQPLRLTAKRASRLRYGDSSTGLSWSLWS